MMVPRAFLFTSNQQHGEMVPRKKSAMDVFSPQDVPDSLPENPRTHTSPVVIPPKRASSTSVHQDFKNGSKSLRRPKKSQSPVPNNIASILQATAIPVPRRGWTVREFQKPPRARYTDNFKLFEDGIRSKEESLMDGSGNTVLDLLLSPPEENEKPVVNDDNSSFSSRSTSSDSVPSLDNDVNSPSSLPVPTPSSQKSSERRRTLSNSEDCAFDHPLLESDLPETEPGFSPKNSGLESVSARRSRSFPRLGSTFKSNLTASLRAIKSAAQTVSTFATPSVQPDDFLTRSLFTITPELTDDRRPPPMNEPPSPALRRYLNPSPAEMHIYHEHPHNSPESSRNCPVSIQMQTYHRSGGSRGCKNGFRLAGSEGSRQDLPFDPEIPPMARQREPRENSDFLRIVVLEMNMRRSGKLRDDIPPRAKVWLPPRQTSHHIYSEYDDDDDNEGLVPSRWAGVSIGCM